MISIDTLITVIAIVLSLGGLIFFHELGHFLVARMFGMGVKVFSLGFGPKLIGFTSGATEYKVCAVPLGGYVALAGETGDEEEENDGFPDEELFGKRPPWQKLCVVAAGPIFNFVLAFFIFWFIVAFQGQGVVLPTVGAVMDDTPAAAAGFQPGDRVLAIDGADIDSWDQMVTTIRASGEREISIDILRDDDVMNVILTPEVRTITNLYGEEVVTPLIGVQMGSDVRYEPIDGIGLVEAVKVTWYHIVGVVKGFKNLLLRILPMDTVGGPIMLAQVIHDGAQSGIFPLLLRVAIISINLAVINLLPIPVLDGGHILFYSLEMLFRRPLSESVKGVAMRLGLMFILGLMALAIFNDIRRLL